MAHVVGLGGELGLAAAAVCCVAEHGRGSKMLMLAVVVEQGRVVVWMLGAAERGNRAAAVGRESNPVAGAVAGAVAHA